MSLNTDILKELKCCLNSDGHIVCKPVLLKCGGNACKNCVNSFDEIKNNCCYCNSKHSRIDLNNSPDNKIAQLLKEKYLEELFDILESKIVKITNDIKGENTYI
jgi:hypothetical protein